MEERQPMHREDTVVQATGTTICYNKQYLNEHCLVFVSSFFYYLVILMVWMPDLGLQFESL